MIHPYYDMMNMVLSSEFVRTSFMSTFTNDILGDSVQSHHIRLYNAIYPMYNTLCKGRKALAFLSLEEKSYSLLELIYLRGKT
jgi:hypothetical protein